MAELQNMKKSADAEKDLAAFKKAAAQAVQEYAQLKNNYTLLKKRFVDSEHRCKMLEKKAGTAEKDLVQLSTVSEEVCHEINELHIKHDVEQKCRITAEAFATKMVKENKDIKRKSAAFLSRAGEDLVRQFEISLDEDDGDEVENGMDSLLVKELNARIDDLKEQLIATKRDLELVALERDEAREEANGIAHQGRHLVEQLHLEKETHEATKALFQEDRRAHEALKMNIEEKAQTIAQFRRVSTVVFQELFEVKGKYEEEAMLREKAENFAAQMYKEKQTADAHKRQSMLMLNETIGPDEKMEELMDEVQQLTKELADNKQSHEKQVTLLEGKLREAQDVEHMESLETKLSIAREENEALERKVNEQEPIIRSLKEKNNEQEATIKKLMAELDKAMLKPVAPPPPPPPPPPPVPHSPLEVLRKIIGGRRAAKGQPVVMELDSKGAAKVPGDPHQKQYEATIDEMMNRIKSGRVKLRPVVTEEKTLLTRKGPGSIRNMSPAMTQLNGMLTVFKKRTTPQGDGSLGAEASSTQAAQSSELLAIMQRRRMKSDEKVIGSESASAAKETPVGNGETDASTKSKRKPPVPVPRSTSTALTKSTSLDSGMITEAGQTAKDASDTASIKTCPEMSLVEHEIYSEVSPLATVNSSSDKKSEMSYSESDQSLRSSSELSSEFSERESIGSSSGKGSRELDAILLHANPAYESAESIQFPEDEAMFRNNDDDDDLDDYARLRIGVITSKPDPDDDYSKIIRDT